MPTNTIVACYIECDTCRSALEAPDPASATHRPKVSLFLSSEAAHAAAASQGWTILTFRILCPACSKQLHDET